MCKALIDTSAGQITSVWQIFAIASLNSVSLYTFSFTHSQVRSENFNWTIPEIINT